jgi:hypothetical protein
LSLFCVGSGNFGAMSGLVILKLASICKPIFGWDSG